MPHEACVGAEIGAAASAVAVVALNDPGRRARFPHGYVGELGRAERAGDVGRAAVAGFEALLAARAQENLTAKFLGAVILALDRFVGACIVIGGRRIWAAATVSRGSSRVGDGRRAAAARGNERDECKKRCSAYAHDFRFGDYAM